MTMRITGANSGLDVDSLVTAAMKPYKTKVDKEVQNRKVLEYQQEQYRTIMNDASDFYDKYFDVLKTGNMLSASTYQTQTYTSSNGTIATAKGLAGASLDNYSINVTQLAAKASDSLSSSDTGTIKMKIGTAEVTFAGSSDGSVTVSNYNAALAKLKTDLTTKVSNGTATDADKTQLSDLNNNTVTAKYSEFTRKVTFTASSFGGSGFTLNVNGSAHDKAEDKYLEATVKNSAGQIYTITSADKKTSNSVTVDNVVFDFKGVSSSTTTTGVAGSISDVAALVDDVSPVAELTALGEADGTTTKETSSDGTTTVTTTSGTKKTITVTLKDGTSTITTTDGNIKTVTDKYGTTTTDTSNPGYTLTTLKSGTTTTTTRNNDDGTIPITKKVEKNGTTTTTTTTIKSGDTTTIKKEINDGTNTSTTTTTEQQTASGSTTTVEEATNGTTSKITTTKLNVASDGTTTKTVRINGGTQDVTTYGTQTTLTGGTDIKDLKEKIVNFVNDYNKLMTEINTKIYETRDKDYMPLTDDQKKSMTDDQITSWEKKAQTGLLRKDSDLERITREMKSAMSAVMSGSGLSLEKIGISPVKNYTDKNGLLTIDEDKLTTALEENGGEVKDLFTRAASATDAGGAIVQLKSALYSEFKSSSSSLSKKAGLVGSSTESDNAITNNITKKKKVITQLNTQLSDKEEALYKKYSALETAMEQLNSQKSSLASMLGQG